jgi:hypothetical protein
MNIIKHDGMLMDDIIMSAILVNFITQNAHYAEWLAPPRVFLLRLLTILTNKTG